MALVAVVLALSGFITHDGLRWWSLALLVGLDVVLCWTLRKSVRLVADAPDDLLDERQIALRNSAHTVAHHIRG
ncbi:MAG: hypothetical protein RI988_914 [Pseudomonadota bacterium]|jgi:hypothetical protein